MNKDIQVAIPSFDNVVCPICKSQKYLNPNMKILVSPCFHKMCETCINRLYTNGAAPCPICKTTLRKTYFVPQTFEDLYVEKEVQIRKKVGKYFNKRLEDFGGNLRQYNDYLEEVEELMFNLINNINVKETNEKIEKWRVENQSLIAANIAKQMNEEKAIAYRLGKEKEEKLKRKEAYIQLQEEQDRAKKMEEEEIINSLASSDKSAKEIITKATAKKPKKEIYIEVEESKEDDIIWNNNDDEDDNLFDPMDYTYIDLDISSKLKYSFIDPITYNIKNDRVAKASGFTPQLTFNRAITSAYTGLFI